MRLKTSKERYWRILLSSTIGVLLIFGILPHLDIFISKHYLEVFDGLKSNIYLDSLFLIFFIITIFISLKRLRKNFYTSVTHTAIVITVSIIYIYIKAHFSSIEFLRFNWFNKIAYLDIIPFYGFTLVLLLIQNIIIEERPNRKYTESTKGFISDKPWVKGDKDLLNRLPVAELVAKQIKEYQGINSFSIGIIGRWGDGKTSFFNQIKTFLDTKNYILIDFTPWNYGHSKSIIESYFSILRSVLKDYSSEIDDLLRVYINLLSKNSNPGFSLFGSLLDNNSQSFIQYYNRLDQTIKNINKRILVFIDDLDRMNEIEIQEIFKIIRQSSNFSNIIFLVGYDRNYISDVISNHIKTNPDTYIDKIFQLEYQLPPINKYIIEQSLNEYLNKYIPDFPSDIRLAIDAGRNQIGSIIADSVSFINPSVDTSNYITSILTNIRDVKKIANSIILQQENCGNLDLGELLLLNLIKHRSFKLYQNIANQRILSIKKETDKLKLIVNQSEFDNIVEKSNQDYPILKQICSDIFDKDKVYIRSITFPHNFNLYFDIGVRGIIPLKEFSALRVGKFSAFQKKIKQWCKEGKIDELLLILAYTGKYTNKQDFENILRIKILLIILQVKNLSEDIIQSINISKNSVLQDVYNEKVGMMADTLTKIILKKCNNNFFNDFLHSLHQAFNYDENFKTALTYSEYKNLCIKRFERHLTKSQRVNPTTFNYYYTCIEKIDASSNIIIAERANELLKQRVLLKPIDFLKTTLTDLYSPPDGLTFSITAFASQIFGSWKVFEDFIYAQDQSNQVVSTVTEFYQGFKNNNYKGFRVGPELQKKIQGIRKLKPH